LLDVLCVTAPSGGVRVYRVITCNCLQEPNAHSDPGITLWNGCSRAAQVPECQYNLQFQCAA